MTNKLTVIRVILLSGIMSLFSLHAAANEDLFSHPVDKSALLTLSQSFSHGQPLVASFTQQRKLAILKRPLISRGNVIFSPEHGVVWQQIKPFSNTLILQSTGLTQIDSQGKATKMAMKSGAGLAELMPKMMRAIFSGNIAQLQQEFELFYQFNHDEKQWQLGMTPKLDVISKAFSKIVITGENDKSSYAIKQLQLISQIHQSNNASKTQPQSDVTTITFSNQAHRTLNAAELDYFLAESPQRSTPE